MCTVLGVARSTYYKSFDKTKSARELENEELKSAIKRIYKENKGIYGAPRIHHILGIEGFNVSLKRVQRRMTELGLCAVTVKKYKPHSSKKVAEGLENVLKRDFTTTSINEKWVGDTWGTSRLAFDGSGRVLRGKESEKTAGNYSVCEFRNGKIYNCDLNASYNIGGTIFYKRIVKDCSGDGTAGHPGKSSRVFEEKYLHTVRSH